MKSNSEIDDHSKLFVLPEYYVQQVLQSLRDLVNEFIKPEQKQTNSSNDQCTKYGTTSSNSEKYFTEISQVNESGNLNTDSGIYTNSQKKFFVKSINDGIELIEQYTSPKYIQDIMKKCFSLVLQPKENLDFELNEQFLTNISKSWQDVKLNGKYKGLDIDRYTSVRENMQRLFSSQIKNHFSTLNEELTPDMQILQYEQQFVKILNEINEVQSKEEQIIHKPFVKVNKIREHLIYVEPPENYDEFIQFKRRFQTRDGIREQHTKLIENYHDIMKQYKKFVDDAYQGTRKVKLIQCEK